MVNMEQSLNTYDIYYDYCSEEGYEERNCIDTVVCTYDTLQDYLSQMRQRGSYYNIYVVCTDENGERW